MRKSKKVVSVLAVMALTSCMCKGIELDAAARVLVDLNAEDVIAVEPNEPNTKTKVHETKAAAKEIQWDSSQYGVAVRTGATEDELDDLIDKIINYRGLSYCPFKGKGDTLKEIETDYGISPVAMLAMWTWESGFGTSPLAINNNNFGGIKGGNGGYRYFESVSEGMTFQGRLIREAYVDEGYNTYSLIASKYCPGNYEWSGNVSGTAQQYANWLAEIMNQIK